MGVNFSYAPSGQQNAAPGEGAASGAVPRLDLVSRTSLALSEQLAFTVGLGLKFKNSNAPEEDWGKERMAVNIRTSCKDTRE